MHFIKGGLMLSSIKGLTTVVLTVLIGAAVLLFSNTATAVGGSELVDQQSWGVQGTPQVDANGDVVLDDAGRATYTYSETNNFETYNNPGFMINQVGDYVYVGGKFTELTNGQEVIPQANFARFDVHTGEPDRNFTPYVKRAVITSVEHNGDLIIGGEIGRYNDNRQGEKGIGALAKIDTATGQLDTAFKARVFGGNSVVRDVVVADDGWLYVAGNFDTANDGGDAVAVEGLARFNPDTGELDRSWIPKGLGFQSFWGVDRSHNSDVVYVAGLSQDQAVHHGFRGISSVDGSVVWDEFVPTDKPEIKEPIYDVVATENGNIFAGGRQHSLYIYNELNNMAVVANHVTDEDISLRANDIRRPDVETRRKGGDYQSVKRFGDTIYATCHCWGFHETVVGSLAVFSLGTLDLSEVNGTQTGWANGIIAYDVNTGLRKMDFDPVMSGVGGGWDSLVDSKGCVWTTGQFDSVGLGDAKRNARNLVRFCSGNQIPGGGVTPPVVETTTTIEATTTTQMPLVEETVTTVAEETTTTAAEGTTTSQMDLIETTTTLNLFETTVEETLVETTVAGDVVDSTIEIVDTIDSTVTTIVDIVESTVEETTTTIASTVAETTATTQVQVVEAAESASTGEAAPAVAVTGSPKYTG